MPLTTNKTKLQELLDDISSLKASEYQSKTVTPNAAGQTVVADNGYDGLSSVIIEGDENLVPSNIPSGIEIFGVTGTRPHSTENCILTISSNVDDGEVRAMNGTDAVAGLLRNGECILPVPSDGIWTVVGYDLSSGRISDEVTSRELKTSDNITLTFFEAIVGCYIMNDASATVTCTNGTTTYTSTGTGAHYFTVYERGTWTVSATINGQEWTYNANVQTHKAKYIEIFNGEVQPELNDNEWTVISVLASSGLAENYFAVGDRKGITLNGTCSKLTFTNQTYYAYILGFNHNSDYEGDGSIHFQFGYDSLSGGRNYAFMSGYSGDSDFYMNSTSTNEGGWASSFIRNTVCSTFYNCLPSSLQGVIKDCTKYSDNTGGGSNTASYVTATEDKIFLLSEFEVQGSRTYANSAEQNYQKQYDYYANGNSKVKYRSDSTSSTASWWLRSTYATSSYRFCRVSTNSSANNYDARYSGGVAPAFCV